MTARLRHHQLACYGRYRLHYFVDCFLCDLPYHGLMCLKLAAFDDYARDHAALVYRHHDGYSHQNHQSLDLAAVRSGFDRFATTRPCHWSTLKADVRHHRTAHAIARNQNRHGNEDAQTIEQFVCCAAPPILAAISKYHG